LALTARRRSRGFADAAVFFWRLLTPVFFAMPAHQSLEYLFYIFQNRANFQGGRVYSLVAF
jgi:hypothetical protein